MTQFHFVSRELCRKQCKILNRKLIENYKIDGWFMVFVSIYINNLHVIYDR